MATSDQKKKLHEMRGAGSKSLLCVGKNGGIQDWIFVQRMGKETSLFKRY